MDAYCRNFSIISKRSTLQPDLALNTSDLTLNKSDLILNKSDLTLNKSDLTLNIATDCNNLKKDHSQIKAKNQGYFAYHHVHKLKNKKPQCGNVFNQISQTMKIIINKSNSEISKRVEKKESPAKLTGVSETDLQQKNTLPKKVNFSKFGQRNSASISFEGNSKASSDDLQSSDQTKGNCYGHTNTSFQNLKRPKSNGILTQEETRISHLKPDKFFKKYFIGLPLFKVSGTDRPKRGFMTNEYCSFKKTQLSHNSFSNNTIKKEPLAKRKSDTSQDLRRFLVLIEDKKIESGRSESRKNGSLFRPNK